MFAQADIEDSIDAYVTSDVESSKIYAIIKEYCNVRFGFIHIRSRGQFSTIIHRIRIRVVEPNQANDKLLDGYTIYILTKIIGTQYFILQLLANALN